MRITFDPTEEMLYIELTDKYPFRTDTQTIPGLAIIYDEEGKVCGIEIEDAKQVVDAPNRVDFEYLAEDEEEPSISAAGD